MSKPDWRSELARNTQAPSSLLHDNYDDNQDSIDVGVNPELPKEKTCVLCGHTKPATLNYFHFDSDAGPDSDGLMNVCAECRNTKRRQSYNPEKARADYIRRRLEETGKMPRKYPV